MDNSAVLDTLQALVQACRDGQIGYRDAAEHLKATRLKAFCEEQSLERARFAGELENEMERLGDRDPNRGGSAAGALHRRWIDLKANLGGGDDTLMSACESGEASAVRSYEEALQKELPSPLRAILERQLSSIRLGCQQAKRLSELPAA